MVPKRLQAKARKLYSKSVRFNGPYLRPDGRKFIVVVRSSGGRSTTLLSRFKMTLHLNRALSCDEEVDHRDEDKSNDALSNLQVLTKSRNAAKAMRLKHGKRQKKQCKTCQREFSVSASRAHRKFCSNSCRSIFYGANQYGNKVRGYCGRGEAG